MIRIAACFTLALGATVARADDWPQWMGPDRDNVWKETGIIEKFEGDKAKILWTSPIAGGYAGPAVAKGKVYATDYVTKDQTKDQLESGNFDRKGSSGTERVLAYDEKTGKELWKYEYPVKYTVSYPSGPRCTPTVVDGKVYALGAEGHLACLNADTGEKVWAVELKEAYKTKSALWGYAAHPLIVGNKLITLAGGEGSHVIALDKDTGKEIWKSQSQKEQGYSPVKLIEVGGKKQLLVSAPTALKALSLETGERIWTTPYVADSGSMIMTPIISGDYIFVGGYRNKNLLVKMKSDGSGVDVVWRDNPKLGLSPVNVQPFLQDNVVYGYGDDGKHVAFEIPSGKRLWTTGLPVTEEPKGSETAFVVKNGDRFVFFAETGHLVFGKLSPKGYEEISRAKVIEQTNSAFGRKVIWCMPAFANKHAYIRNDKEIICVDLAK